MIKKCFKCQQFKPLDEFYVHPRMGDGHLNKCKDCTRNDTMIRTNELMNDPIWVEKEKRRARAKYHRLQYKEKHKPTPEAKRLTMVRYKEKYPEKIRAASVSGKLKPIIKGNHLHHWSYNEDHFKDCIELSERDHNFLHRYVKYDQTFKMYRRNDTNELLDTKQKHIDFYNHCLKTYPF